MFGKAELASLFGYAKKSIKTKPKFVAKIQLMLRVFVISVK